MMQLSRKSPLPFYRQIEDWFRAEIEAGRLAADDAVPDELSLAKRLGLSRMTVRRAIMTLTEDGLLYRIRGRGTFVKGGRKSDAPKAMATVGIISPFGQTILRQSFFYYRILQGLQEATFERGLALVHRTLNAPFDASLTSVLSNGQLDALIVLGLVDRAALKVLADCRLPLVLLDSAQPDSGKFDSVSHTGADSSFEATRHLLELGHRDIALLTFDPTPAALERSGGFERALATRQLKLAENRLLICECNGSAAYAAVRQMLREGKPPTALFCTTDELALGALGAIKDHGWRVPQDMSIVGYGDLGYFCQPALSTVRIGLEEMGRKAAELLRARIDLPQAPPANILFPSEFVARASSDLPRVSEGAKP
jgi:DNA-binding LacI/PurR family transcriptional regulator